MKRLRKIFTSVDMFGADYEFVLVDGETTFKSTFGGLSSIVIYSLSAAYAIYMLIQYFQGQVLPKITYQESLTDYQAAQYDKSPFKINFLYEADIVDPFQKENNILTPFLLTIDFVNITNIQILFPNDKGSVGYSSTIEKINFELVINLREDSQQYQPQRQQLLIFTRCQTDLLKIYSNDSFCASEDDIEKFLDRTSRMVINLAVQLQQYNPSDKVIENVQSENYLMIDKNFMTYNEVSFIKSQVSVSDGFIIASSTDYSLNTNVDIITQTLSTNFFQNYSPKFSVQTSYASFLMRLDSTIKNTDVEYILIGSVLADILSIIEVLFWGSFLAQYFNGIWLKQYTIQQILQQYFPQLQNVQFQWNFDGRISVRNQKGQELESEHDKELFQRLAKQTEQKQELISLFSNLAKIEMLLEVLIDHHAIEAGELGFQLPKLEMQQKELQSEIQMQEFDTDRSSNEQKFVESRTINRYNTQTMIAFRRFGQNDRQKYKMTDTLNKDEKGT